MLSCYKQSHWIELDSCCDSFIVLDETLERMTICSVGRKTQIEKLTDQYTSLMKRSYEKALVNTEESKIFHEKAMIVRDQIQQLNYSFAEN